MHDYVGGKADWVAAGLPTEGPGSTTLRAGTVARRDVPTCLPDDTLATARSRMTDGGWDRCVVINDAHVVMGVVDEHVLADDETAAVETVMRLGPATVRTSEELAGLARRMHDRHVTSILVTDPEGRLIGVVLRDEADRALDRSS